jgi:2-oxoglutarate ferredoxin oxidoreductase subunit beta
LQENVLDKKTVLGLDIGCSLLAWDFLDIHTFQTHHGRVTPTMAGYKMAKPDSICLAYTGDGGAYSIGLQSLLWSAKRNDPITVIVINNTVYGMTGGQSSPTTLLGQKTSTAPSGYENTPLLGPELVRQISDKAYLVRVACNQPNDLKEVLSCAIKAQEAGNFSLVEVLSYCPTNWKTKGIETNNYLEEKLRPVFRVGEI